MQVDIFDFELDRSLIADRPADPRDSSRQIGRASCRERV